jgi:hypothetical protein
MIAKLIKHKTEDGFVEMYEDIPLGKIYKVLEGSIQYMKGLHLPTGTWWRREMIQCEDGTFIPTELLKIENENKQN